MAEVHIMEIIRICVAVATRAGVMVSGRRVTCRTIGTAYIGVTEIGIAEIVRVLMAGAAGAAVMIGRW